MKKIVTVKKKVVVVGGGTGTHTVLRGLRPYADILDITAIVSMADSGGSTGRLRDEFGFLPIGDVRNALTALAAEGDEYDKLLRELFSYRFNKGEGLSGHNFGNLLMTALTDILGSEVLAIEATSNLLRVAGKVVPVTTDQTHLEARYENGEILVGEHEIDEVIEKYNNLRIIDLILKPKAKLYEGAREALCEADLIVLGPGDLYTSVIANFIVDGFCEALDKSQAKLIYVCNLMSKKGQTVGLNAKEHVEEIIKYAKHTPDIVIVNSTNFSEEEVLEYKKEGNFPVLNNCTKNELYEISAQPLVSRATIKKSEGDMLKRSLVRHDPAKLANVILEQI
ncbi:MAG: YvcK family protein [Candidatus Paceibacterota bacterium]